MYTKLPRWLYHAAMGENASQVEPLTTEHGNHRNTPETPTFLQYLLPWLSLKSEFLVMTGSELAGSLSRCMRTPLKDSSCKQGPGLTLLYSIPERAKGEVRALSLQPSVLAHCSGQLRHWFCNELHKRQIIYSTILRELKQVLSTSPSLSFHS